MSQNKTNWEPGNGIRVAFFPDSARHNPYLDLLEKGLKSVGVVVAQDVPHRPYMAWLREQQNRVNVLHFHWIEGFYNYENKKDAYRASIVLPLQLWQAKRLGMRIVWTMHNIYPHERHYPYIDRFIWYLMAQMSDSIIAHCDDSKERLFRKWRRNRNVHVIHHGNYGGLLDSLMLEDQKAVRANLGINRELRLFLFFGSIRPYKGLETLIETFLSIQQKEIRLVIAGKPIDADYGEKIGRLCAKDPRIDYRRGWLEESEVAGLLQACDAVILPFIRAQTSGSVIMAMTYGRPVIVPAIGCLPELIGEGSGILFDPSKRDSLRDAIDKALLSDLASMGKEASGRVTSMTWSEAARLTLNAYMGPGEWHREK